MNPSSDIPLGQDQNATIRQFCDICGMKDESEAARFLQACHWNIEQAIPLYYEQNDENRDSTLQDRLNFQAVEDSREQPINHSEPIQGEVPSLTPSWFLSQIKTFGLRIVSFSTSFFALMRLFCTTLTSVTSALGTGNFNTFFHEQYGPEGPTFNTKSLLQVYEEAKQENKVLVLYIHNSEANGTVSFVRNILQTDLWRARTNDPSCILWGCKSDDAAIGALIRQQLLICRHFPHLSFIVISDESNQSSSSLSVPNSDPVSWMVVGAVEGATGTLDEAIQILDSSLVMIQSMKDKKLRKSEEATENRRIRLEQDEAYMKALIKDAELKADREAKKKKIEEEQQHRISLEKSNSSKLESKKIKSREKAIEFLKSRHEANSTALKILYRIRLPDGNFFDQKFDPDTTKLSCLYDWIDTIAYLQTLQSKSREDLITSIRSLLNLSTDTLSDVETLCGSPIESLLKAVIPPTYTLISSTVPLKEYTPSSQEFSECLSSLGFNTQTLFFLKQRSTN